MHVAYVFHAVWSNPQLLTKMKIFLNHELFLANVLSLLEIRLI